MTAVNRPVRGVRRCAGTRLFGLALAAVLLAAAPGGAQELSVQNQWDLFDTYGREGHVGVRVFADIDDDGENEVIFNLGRSADFVALEMDGTEIWRSTIEETNSKQGYNPRVSLEHGLLFYGSRASNTLYAVNLSDGSLAWSREVSGRERVRQMSVELADVGVLVGHDGEQGRTVQYDFEGNVMPGWPIEKAQHEQLLCAGDLDGDGQDEFLLNDNSGNFAVHKRDGSVLFSKRSTQNHLDYSVIADINQNPDNPNNIGNELLVAIDDDDSHNGEGDEIVLFNAEGNEIARYETGSSGVNYAVGDVLPDRPGLEVFFGNEGSNTIGLLDHTLRPIFVSNLAPFAEELGIPLENAAGQTALADLDGDGTLELLINSGENAEAGILVFDTEGNLLDSLPGHGWDFDPQSIFSQGDPQSKQFTDVNGDGRADILVSAVGADSPRGDRTVYLLGNLAPETPSGEGAAEEPQAEKDDRP